MSDAAAKRKLNEEFTFPVNFRYNITSGLFEAELPNHARIQFARGDFTKLGNALELFRRGAQAAHEGQEPKGANPLADYGAAIAKFYAEGGAAKVAKPPVPRAKPDDTTVMTALEELGLL